MFEHDIARSDLGPVDAALMNLMARLEPLNRVFVSDDYARALALIAEHVPLKVLSFDPGEQVNGWWIPPSWQVLEATISHAGEVIYDGTSHPLAVVACSSPFEGRVDRETLRRHLYYDSRYEEDIPFHFRYQYRPWERDWGFCVPQSFYASLKEGMYDVKLVVKEESRPLLVGVAELPGESPETYVLAAHLDHPGMANDDLSGVITGMMVFNALRELPRRKYSYRLIIVQEILGSEFYLHYLKSHEKKLIRSGLFLDMLGTRTPLTLQASYYGDSDLEFALAHALDSMDINFERTSFRTLAGNDEICWEAHGIPMPYLTRFPYPEYHSSRDNMGIISPQALLQCRDVCLRAISFLERNVLIRKNFTGVMCLSNPEYDLYVDLGRLEFGTRSNDSQRKSFKRLMDSLPILLLEPMTMFDLARQFDLSFPMVADYVDQWHRKGLLQYEDIPTPGKNCLDARASAKGRSREA